MRRLISSLFGFLCLLLLAARADAGGAIFYGRSSSVPPAPIPTGVYVGGLAYNGSGGKPAKEAAFEAIEATTGTLAFQLSYYGWKGITASALLKDPMVQGNFTHGRITLMAWNCGEPMANTIAGLAGNPTYAASKAIVDGAAQTLKATGKPIILRWFHEDNLCGVTSPACANGDNPNCYDQTMTIPQKAAQHRQAFEAIHDEFAAVGATNVQFMDNPNVNANDPVLVAPTSLAAFVPPNTPPYTDIILGCDVYDKSTNSSGSLVASVGFSTLISPCYSLFGSDGRPIFITETGECNDAALQTKCNADLDPNVTGTTQQAYFAAMASVIPSTYPNIHGIGYFSSHPSSWNWILTTAGINALATLHAMPYFSCLAASMGC